LRIWLTVFKSNQRKVICKNYLSILTLSTYIDNDYYLKIFSNYKITILLYNPNKLYYVLQLTSRIVSVCEDIWIFIWDWLVGKFSLEQERFNLLEPDKTALLFNIISVFTKTLWMYAELKPRILNAVLSTFCGFA